MVTAQQTGAGGVSTVDPAGSVALLPSPVVTGVVPPVGTTAGGTVVTIHGVGFSGATAVTFGGTPATSFTVDSDTQITATTPAHAAGIAQVQVTTPSGTSSSPVYFVYLPTTFPPTVAAVVPPIGPTSGGTVVTIYGVGFSGATAVTFGGTPATSFTVDSDTQITATTPAHAAGIAQVQVTTPSGTSSSPVYFVYSPTAIPPTVAAVLPPIGPTSGGTVVTIFGVGFTGATAVTFGGTPATSFTVDSDTQITATTPAHAAGIAQVLVTTPSGTSSGLAFFTYIPTSFP